MARKKVLIIGPSWVGDMVMAQTLFLSLKKHDPEVIIDVLAPAFTRPLLERMPEVNQALSSPFGHGQLKLKARFELGKVLRGVAYDQAIVLPNSFKSALVPLFARIPRRTGWVGEMRWGVLSDARRLNEEKLPLMIQRFIALGLPRGSAVPEQPAWPGLTVTEEGVEQALKQQQVKRPTRPVLALCPGAEFGPSKRWPEVAFAALAKAKAASGWDIWLFGSQKDREVTEKIQAQSGGVCLDLAGRTNLTEAMDLLSLATVVVTNDSGLMHVAAALHRPLVAVYGSTSPHFTPPLTKQARILSSSLDCSPCFKRDCPLGHHRCMLDITPEQVSEAINTLVEL